LGLWTIWGVAVKLSTRYADTSSLILAQGVGNMVVTLAVAVWTRFHIQGKPTGLALGLAAGIVGTLGTLFFYMALSRGRASVVVPMTALYPLLVAIIGITVLREPFTWKVGLGTGFAVVAMLLFSI
jgi:transporter family protein